MGDNNANELIEVDHAGSGQFNVESGETTVQLMQNFTSTVIGLSKQIAENNEAKFRAQAEVMIAGIRAKMQEEVQDINGYYDKRKQQGETFDSIITEYQRQFKDLTNSLISAENESVAERVKWAIEKLESGVGDKLDKLAGDTLKEQNTRIETSKSRSKGLLGFFRRG